MKFKPPDNTRLHWNYFLALEKDIEAMSRYIEFCPDNMNTYSIELAHLLLSAASEIDTVAKCVCNILDPKEKPENINNYRRIIKKGEDTETDNVTIFNLSIAGKKPSFSDLEPHRHRLSKLKVYIPRYTLEFMPWKEWASDRNPDWWLSYNQVKHERNRHFNKATLQNALNALAGLLAMNYFHCRLEMTKDKAKVRHRYQYKEKNVTRYMEPQSTFLVFGSEFYDDPIADLAKNI